jgi:hypothetical protein
MPIKSLDFSLAYRFAECTLRAIKKPSEYDIEDIIGDFLGVGEDHFFKTIFKPSKYTLLHEFIKNINFSGIEWETSHMDHDYLIETYGPCIIAAGYEIPEWFNDGNIRDHAFELDDILNSVSESITEATFNLLFADRDFLFVFSKFVANFIRNYDQSDSIVFSKKGVVKRVTYLPKWLRNALFHRDKARCQICKHDLTGLLRPQFDIHIDHMLPLEQSGTNDPTNFQLLCESCNTSKGKKIIVEKQVSYTYW